MTIAVNGQGGNGVEGLASWRSAFVWWFCSMRNGRGAVRFKVRAWYNIDECTIFQSVEEFHAIGPVISGDGGSGWDILMAWKFCGRISAKWSEHWGGGQRGRSSCQ